MAAALATLSGSHARAHPSTSACAYDFSVRSVGQNGIYKTCYGYGCQVVERLSKLCARALAHSAMYWPWRASSAVHAPPLACLTLACRQS